MLVDDYLQCPSNCTTCTSQPWNSPERNLLSAFGTNDQLMLAVTLPFLLLPIAEIPRLPCICLTCLWPLAVERCDSRVSGILNHQSNMTNRRNDPNPGRPTTGTRTIRAPRSCPLSGPRRALAWCIPSSTFPHVPSPHSLVHSHIVLFAVSHIYVGTSGHLHSSQRITNHPHPQSHDPTRTIPPRPTYATHLRIVTTPCNL